MIVQPYLVRDRAKASDVRKPTGVHNLQNPVLFRPAKSYANESLKSFLSSHNRTT